MFCGLWSLLEAITTRQSKHEYIYSWIVQQNLSGLPFSFDSTILKIFIMNFLKSSSNKLVSETSENISVQDRVKFLIFENINVCISDMSYVYVTSMLFCHVCGMSATCQLIQRHRHRKSSPFKLEECSSQ